jgi:small subunit ribosomal protein S13
MAKEITKETKLIRLVDRDIIGDTSIYVAITKVRGADFMISNAICNILNIPKNKPIQDLSADDLKKIEDVMRNPKKYNIPSWMLNRRKDPETGEDTHLISADLKLRQQFDVRHLRKMKCYKGVRHARGLRVRGQRTRTTGRTGKTVGVARKKGKKK